MTKTKRVEQCKTGRDFIDLAYQNGGYVENYTGSHANVRGTSGGKCPVPVHNKDLPTGTRHSIIKMFRAIGLLTKIVVIGAGIFYALTQLM